VYVACGGPGEPVHAPAPAEPTASAIGARAANPFPDDGGDWIRPARDLTSTRFSSLDQITVDSVAELGVKATFSTGVVRGHEAAPIVAGGTMFIVTPFPNLVYALDLSQPGLPMKWRFDPKVLGASQGVACCDVVNRGVVYSDGTVYPSGRTVPSIGTAVGHAFLGAVWPDNRWSRSYRLADWDRSTEREVDWISGAAFLLRRAALDEIGLLDERFFLYAEEVDLFKRLRDAGWSIVFTPELEVVHEQGVSTGRSRRMHLIHSESVSAYFEKHHGTGWRRALVPIARIVLRMRAEAISAWDRLRGPAR